MLEHSILTFLLVVIGYTKVVDAEMAWVQSLMFMVLGSSLFLGRNRKASRNPLYRMKSVVRTEFGALGFRV